MKLSSRTAPQVYLALHQLQAAYAPQQRHQMIYLSSLDEVIEPNCSSNIPGPPSTSSGLCSTAATPGCCASCALPITDQYFLLMNDESWHCECLRCCICRCSLHGASKCYYKDGMVLCRNDYIAYEFYFHYLCLRKLEFETS
ncbi:unnamed protein product [Gongylonema pulchrum]|uniref:LIM zinc-binding domain-containing protein n=1 Tax=Gongylonema pulchrum TaxID=637853 RepID=A0A183EXB6_9BILA|nr:unnamed protein product [Gongylonema pulchrum]